MVLSDVFIDGLFAALAGVGFASISNPPRMALVACAFMAALGHATRFCLMSYLDVRIAFASLAGGVVIGLLGVPLARKACCPVEACTLPALLPMVPGMYAYRSVQALLQCLRQTDEAVFMHHFYLLSFNFLTCVITILLMGVGAAIPTFVMRKK